MVSNFCTIFGYEKVYEDCYNAIQSLDKKSRKACLSLLCKFSGKIQNYRLYGFDIYIGQLVYEDTIRKVHTRFLNETRPEYLLVKALMIGSIRKYYRYWSIKPISNSEKLTIDAKVRSRINRLIWDYRSEKKVYSNRRENWTPEEKMINDFCSFMNELNYRPRV